MCKLQIRTFSVPYCIKKSKDQREYKAELDRQLKQYLIDLDTCSSPENLDKYTSTKNELESLEKIESNGYIFRSKCQFYEDGEKTQSIS